MNPTDSAPISDSSEPDWKTVLEFVRQENKLDREHLEQTFHRVVWGTGVMLLVAVAIFYFLVYHSLSEARQAVATEMKQQLADEFNRPELQRLIHDAARDAVNDKLGTVIAEAVRTETARIQRETESEVKRIKEQSNNILLELQPRRLSNTQGRAIDTFLKNHTQEIKSMVGMAGVGFLGIVSRLGDPEALGYAQQFIPWLGNLGGTLASGYEIPEADSNSLAVCITPYEGVLDPAVISHARENLGQLIQKGFAKGNISVPVIHIPYCGGGGVGILVGRKTAKAR